MGNVGEPSRTPKISHSIIQLRQENVSAKVTSVELRYNFAVQGCQVYLYYCNFFKKKMYGTGINIVFCGHLAMVMDENLCEVIASLCEVERGECHFGKSRMCSPFPDKDMGDSLLLLSPNCELPSCSHIYFCAAHTFTYIHSFFLPH